MKLDPSPDSPRPIVAMIVVSGLAVFGLSACGWNQGGGGNAFTPPPPPRYGYGGVQSPNYQPPPPRNVAPAPVRSGEVRPSGTSGGQAKPKPVKVIKRDPNNTDIDLTPPPAPAGSGVERPAVTEPAVEPTPTPAVEPKPEAVEPAPVPTPAPAPAPKPVVREDLPYGIPAVTKPGCVYSPYMTTQLVEVAGLARGTKVKCPYTGKHFRVP